MSGAHLLQLEKDQAQAEGRDVGVATPEEFVRRFGGSHVINKVCIDSFC